MRDSAKPYDPGAPGIVGGDLPGDVYDNPNRTWREYGQRVGVWRMFAVFEAEGVPTSCTGLHPHVIGQPFRIRARRDFLRYARGFEGVRFATRAEIADWHLENHASHI